MEERTKHVESQQQQQQVLDISASAKHVAHQGALFGKCSGAHSQENPPQGVEGRLRALEAHVKAGENNGEHSLRAP